MASSNMQYFVRTPDGKEYGPAEQDVLVQWVKSGRVTAQCQIRNALVKKWAPAHKIAFLEEILKDDDAASKAEGDAGPQKREAIFSLNRPGRFKFVPATVGLRCMAWLFDMLLVGGIALVLFLITDALVKGGMDGEAAYTLFTLAVGVVYVLYYTLVMGLSAQTFGQWFWGLMVVRPDGRPVLVGRAFCFALAQVLFNWSTLVLVFVLPGRTALQDLCCGLRVIRITVREIAAARV
jgi:uncharacterized RDD family membrane protein YckC